MLLFILLSYTIPFDSPIMTNIEYLQVKHLIDLPSIKPYEIDWLVPQIDELLINEANLNSIDKKIISRFEPFLVKDLDRSNLSHFKAWYESEPELYGGFLDGRLGGRLTSNVAYAQALRVRRGSELDPLGPRPWHDFQAYLNEGFVKFDFEKVKFYVGRRNYQFNAYSEQSLLLSFDPQGYDGFFVVLPSQYYEFYNVFVMLDAAPQRYLSVHRIGLNFRKFLKIGFSEAILFANALEPLYLNFFFPYYLAQWGLERDDNIMWCLDGQLGLANSIIYGEFLIDDYMYEDDPYPNKLAYQVGLKSLWFSQFFLKVNYTFVDKWVYTHHDVLNTYEDASHSLGFALGNDVDQRSFSLKFMNRFGIFPAVVLDYSRQGEGLIFLPYEQEGGDWAPPFPSGIVEKKLDIKLTIDYTLQVRYYLTVGLGRRYWSNYNHVTGDDRDETLVNLTLWAIL